MANMQKNYYYAPEWTYKPDDPRGIALGNIIISPDTVWPPLLPATKDPLLDDLMPSNQYDVRWKMKRARWNRFGAYSKVLQSVLGVGVDASIDTKSSNDVDFVFSRLETKKFWPTKTYLRERMGQAEVVNYLKGRLSFDRVAYMVVGVIHACGASAKTAADRSNGITIDTGADLTVSTGAPVSLGVSVSPGRERSETVSWNSSDDFVFAFSVARITVQKGDPLAAPYRRGAMYDAARKVPAGSTFKIDEVDEWNPRRSIDGLNDLMMVAEDFASDESLIKNGIVTATTEISKP